MNWFSRKDAPPPPPSGESLVLRGDRLEQDKNPANKKVAQEMDAGMDLYLHNNYPAAEKVFHRIAEDTKNPVEVAEKARYYEAHCLHLQQRLPRAADTYMKMLNDFPSGAYREQAVHHLDVIANYWLNDTREEMRQEKEQREGKLWVVWPHFFHWDKTKPWVDERGRALQALEQVRYNDITGPLGDKALFLIGCVKFHEQDYRDADHYFSQLVERHPNSPYAAKALELAIISKQLSTGGADYDGRAIADARKLIDVAGRSYPELATRKEQFLHKQLTSIISQQAEKDYKIAEFYRRTGHPGSAYFYYNIVLRRYHDVPAVLRAGQEACAGIG